jgi:hypothetical protein
VRASSTIRLSLIAALVGAVLAACDTGVPGLTASPSPGPSSGASQSAALPTATPSAPPTAAPWPADWHDGFCAAYVNVVIAQQLARDIGRSLAADDTNNAIGLAHELTTTVSDINAALDALPDWSAGADSLTAVRAMLDADATLADYYLRYLEGKHKAALPKAQAVEQTLRDGAIAAVAVALAPLVSEGFACADTSFELETP